MNTIKQYNDLNDVCNAMYDSMVKGLGVCFANS